MLPVPSYRFDDRVPALVLLCDRKIKEPEHTHNPCRKNPAKELRSHGALPVKCLFALICCSASENGNDHSWSNGGTKRGKSLWNGQFENQILRHRHVFRRPFGGAPTVRRRREA